MIVLRPNREDLEMQKFRCDRSEGQDNHYSRSYMTQEASINVFEHYGCVL